MSGTTAHLDALLQRRWWHSIRLADGNVTPGVKSIETMDAEFITIFDPIDLRGKSVLDVGAWDGGFSIAAKRRGADRVVALDHVTWNHPAIRASETFEFATHACGVEIETVDQELDVPQLSLAHLGSFDVVLFLGVFYHLMDPIAALREVSACAREVLVLETYLEEVSDRTPSMVFYPGAELNDDPTNWWGPNRECVEQLLRANGFTAIAFQKSCAYPNRGVFHAYRPSHQRVSCAAGPGFPTGESLGQTSAKNAELGGMGEDLVRSAYRVLLGREPESEDVLRRPECTVRDPEAILRAFIECDEFKARHRSFATVISDGFTAKRLPVETEVAPDVLDKMFNRIKTQWQELGEREPYWSVVTWDQYLRSTFDANIDAFNESGKGHAAMVDYLPARNGIRVHGGTCLELGCGVGRVTRFLAERFDHVIAVDISPGNIKLGQEYLKQRDIKNVEFRLISGPSDIACLDGFSFFYSFLVLQHNPPPVQKFMLENIFRNMQRGGCAVFQIPTFWTDYTFSADTYLQSSLSPMEMHALPMHTVFAIIAECGLICKEVAMDNATGVYGSHTFVAAKH